MDEQQPGAITVVGLGPGGAELITRQAWDVLTSAGKLFLRTTQHPAVAELPDDLQYASFDHIYEGAEEFTAVYAQIASQLLQAARKGQSVVYAVPGDPAVAEASVSAIRDGANAHAITVRVLPGVSFVEPTLAALEVDALDGLQLFDAISLAGYNHPPVNPDFPVLLGQVYSRLLANDLKLSLMAVYPDDHQVTLIHAAGTSQQRLDTLPLYEIDRSRHIDVLTSLFIPPLAVQSSLQALAEVTAVLRSPEGCPWDREQTPQSLRPDFLEEVAEMVDALDADDPYALEEEIGDVLFHLVMQAQMAREEELFRLGDVIAGIIMKLRRRHPHVWGEVEVRDSNEVIANWEKIKADEKGSTAPASLLDGVPLTLPALMRSQKIQERVRRVGFDWPDSNGVKAKLREELEELESAREPSQQAAELGDVLFAAVNLARWLGIDADSALREANLRFTRRFQKLETLAQERGIDLAQADLDMLEQLWQEAKQLLQQEREG